MSVSKRIRRAHLAHCVVSLRCTTPAISIPGWIVLMVGFAHNFG
jgi:hypothetical protein